MQDLAVKLPRSGAAGLTGVRRTATAWSFAGGGAAPQGPAPRRTPV